MAKITLIKPYRQTETLRLYEMADLVELIRNGEFSSLVDDVRSYYPMMRMQREADGTMSGGYVMIDKLPRICFASEMENRNHQRVMLGYTGLVLLEVNNLTGFEEAAAIRKAAGEVPQTLLAFVGGSGRSVKIVCRGELFPSENQGDRLLDPIPNQGPVP